MVEYGSWKRAASGAGLLGDDGRPAATIFSEMSELAAATGAVNLGQGFPDDAPPSVVANTARSAIARGENQYPPGRGTTELREAISRHQQHFYGLSADPEREVLVTAGATEALAATLLALTEPGDEVLTFEPFYDAYGALIELAGARHVTVPLHWPNFDPSLDRLDDAVSDRTRIILLNDPHNPSGAVFDRATLERVVGLAHRHDAIIVTDEVYEHLTYGTGHSPIATLPGADSRTVTISSGGKTFSATGWKIGWLTAPSDIVTAITTVKQYLTYATGTPFQPAIAAGLGLPDEHFSQLAAEYEHKRDLLGTALDRAGIARTTPSGGYFIVADVQDVGFDDAVSFCREIPTSIGVVAVPINAFVCPENRQHYRSLVRFAFCKSEATIREGVARLEQLSGR